MAFEQRSLEDYIDVAQRIADFRAKYPKGVLRPWNIAEPFKLVQAMGWDKNGEQVMQTFIVVVAAAYREQSDPEPGVGMAWEIFPGRTPYTRGSELQNAETSAWGRAIIAVGASDSKRGIASREEVRNRQAERDVPVQCPFCKDEYTDMHEHLAADLKGCGSKYRAMPLSDRELLFLPRNKDGSLSRSRMSDAEKAAAGVMTDAEQRAHNALAKPPPNTGKVTRIRPDTGDGRSLPCVKCGRTTPDASYVDGLPTCDECAAIVDAAVDDRWTTDAPSWLVGVDPPEDQPGSILPAQLKQMHAVYSALGIKDRTERLADAAEQLDLPGLASASDLSHQQAARLLENLHERHTGKMTRR